MSGEVHLKGLVDGEEADYSINKFSILASGESNWNLDGVWMQPVMDPRLPRHCICLFRHKQTSEMEWFLMKEHINIREIVVYHIPAVPGRVQLILGLCQDIKSVLKYQTEIDEEIGTLKAKLEGSEKERKNEIEEMEENRLVLMASAFGVGLVVATIVALGVCMCCRSATVNALCAGVCWKTKRFISRSDLES